MTLQELWSTVRRYSTLIVVVSIACAIFSGLGCYVVGQIRDDSYNATAQVLVADPSSILSPTSLLNYSYARAESVIAQDYEGENVEASIGVPDQSLLITAESAVSLEASNLANEVATSVKAEVETAFARQAELYLGEVGEAEKDVSLDNMINIAANAGIEDRAAALKACSVTVVESKSGNYAELAACAKSAGFGLVIGFSVVLLALIFKVSVRRPIMGRENVREITDIRVLSDETSASACERLWAYVGALYSEEIVSICIVSSMADIPTDFLNMLIAEVPENIKVAVGGVLDIGGLRSARESDAVLLVAKKWVDSERSLSMAVSDLQGIGANCLGIVLV